MTTWFTSDTHYWHKAIIQYCKRPFSSVEEMNANLIANYQSCVKPEDHVYHLGDFGFGSVDRMVEIIKQLPGRKHLILGNHDRKLAGRLASYFEEVVPYKLLMEHMKYKDDAGSPQQYHMPIVLFHFPIESWDRKHHGSWHLHGHSHGMLSNDSGLRLDVGVDCWNMTPVSLETIQKEMERRTTS